MHTRHAASRTHAPLRCGPDARVLLWGGAERDCSDVECQRWVRTDYRSMPLDIFPRCTGGGVRASARVRPARTVSRPCPTGRPSDREGRLRPSTTSLCDGLRVGGGCGSGLENSRWATGRPLSGSCLRALAHQGDVRLLRLFRLLAQEVAGGADGEEVTRVERVYFQFETQPGHVGVDGAAHRTGVVSPHIAQQIGA
jgi:hypothetical protein